MLKTFFFIPADKPKFLEGLKKYDPDYFILDLEDSSSSNSNEIGLQNLLDINDVKSNYFVRVNLLDDISSTIEMIKAIYPKYKNIKLPKIESSDQLEEIFSSIGKHFNINEYKFILSIESPKGIINLKEIFEIHSNRFIGMSIGTHDYCKEMNATHELKNFDYARNTVLNYCKAYDKIALDFASTNMSDEIQFAKECIAGFRMGFDGKALLHPWQLNIIENLQFYSDDEIKIAIKVYKIYNNSIPKDMSAIKINGRIIEKPHLKRLTNIIGYLKKTNSELL